MNKEITNYIIPPWDSRYGKLGHIWKKYNWDTVYYKYGTRMTYFYLPPELIINEYEDRRGRRFLKYKTDDQWNNWMSSFASTRNLHDCCNLSPEDYYNLVILHNNSKIDIPRCNQCKSLLTFNRLSQGYSNRGHQVDRKTLFCSNRCHARYEGLHPDEYNGKLDSLNRFYHESIKYDAIAKRLRSTYLSKGGLNDESVVYIAELQSDNYYKFGVTSNIEQRIYMSDSYNKISLTNVRIILQSTRLECANLEASIKLKFKFNSEFILPEYYDKVLEYVKTQLANRPIANPFE